MECLFCLPLKPSRYCSCSWSGSGLTTVQPVSRELLSKRQKAAQVDIRTCRGGPYRRMRSLGLGRARHSGSRLVHSRAGSTPNFPPAPATLNPWPSARPGDSGLAVVSVAAFATRLAYFPQSRGVMIDYSTTHKVHPLTTQTSRLV